MQGHRKHFKSEAANSYALPYVLRVVYTRSLANAIQALWSEGIFLYCGANECFYTMYIANALKDH